CSREPSVRMDQEAVGGAVAPTIHVGKRVAEECPSEIDDSVCDVSGNDENPTRQVEPTREGEYGMDEEGKPETGYEHAETANGSRAAIPAHEVRRKPHEPCGHGEWPAGIHGSEERESQSGTDQPPAGHQVECQSPTGGACVCRKPAVVGRDRYGSQAAGCRENQRDREGGEALHETSSSGISAS